MRGAAAVDRGAVRQLQLQLGTEGVAELAAAFLDSTPARLAGMRAAAGAGDASQLREQAHALKGAARGFGAAEMGDIAAQIERESAAGSLAHAGRLLVDLTRSVGRTRAEFEQQLGRRSGAVAAIRSLARRGPAGQMPSPPAEARIAQLEMRVESLERLVARLRSQAAR
jgi:HPt (histidine-containing phosphotransfer) domain-containing protein